MMKLDDILESNKFKSLMLKQTREMIGFLLNHGIPFSILANASAVAYRPALPSYLKEKIEDQPIVKFDIENYSFDTAKAERMLLIFHAGFGSSELDIFEAVVYVHYNAIKQVLIDDQPIFMNRAQLDFEEDLFYEQSDPVDDINHSLNAFSSNPENADLLKK